MMSIPKKQMRRVKNTRLLSSQQPPFLDTVHSIVSSKCRCIQSIDLEFSPRTTWQYAKAIHSTTVLPVHVHVKHDQLFITDGWRIRRECLTDKELVQVQCNPTFENRDPMDRSALQTALILRLAPAARAAVRALLLCPALLS